MLRNDFVDSLDLDKKFKVYARDAARHLSFNSVLNLLVELTKPIYRRRADIPKKIYEFAAGYPFVLHTCAMLTDEETTKIYMTALHKKREEVLKDMPVELQAIKDIEDDSAIWRTAYKDELIVKRFKDCSFTEDDFVAFEDIMLRHRAYGFIFKSLLRNYISVEEASIVDSIINNVSKGFGYFYDAAPYDEAFSQTFATLYTQHIMASEYDIDCVGADYETMQRYIMASGVYSHMLKKSADYYRQAYDASVPLGQSSGKRRLFVKKLAQNSEKLVAQYEASLRDS